jgi:hypothetical protein
VFAMISSQGGKWCYLIILLANGFVWVTVVPSVVYRC